MTHRQFRVWQLALGFDYDRPTRDTFYLMQIAQQVAAIPSRVWGKADKTPLASFRLRFGEPEERPNSTTREAAAAWSKALWSARLGLNQDEQGKK